MKISCSLYLVELEIIIITWLLCSFFLYWSRQKGSGKVLRLIIDDWINFLTLNSSMSIKNIRVLKIHENSLVWKGIWMEKQLKNWNSKVQPFLRRSFSYAFRNSDLLKAFLCCSEFLIGKNVNGKVFTQHSTSRRAFGSRGWRRNIEELWIVSNSSSRFTNSDDSSFLANKKLQLAAFFAAEFRIIHSQNS